MSISEKYQQYIGMPNIFDLYKIEHKLEQAQETLWKLHKGYEPYKKQQVLVYSLQDKYNKLRLKINHVGNRQSK